MNSKAMQVNAASGSYVAKAEAQDVPPGYKRTDVGVIPEDWDAIPLGTLFKFKNGLNKAKRFFGYGTPIVNYMDVYSHRGLVADDLVGRVSLSSQELENFEVRKGDVFFTRTSETIEEIGAASVMLDEPRDTVFSGFVLRARPVSNSLEDQYKKYCFASPLVRTQITSTSTYTTRALTNGRLLSAVSIAVPRKSEQLAIAEALSDVDGLLGTLEALIAKKHAIKQGAMQQLLTGNTRLPGFSGKWAEASFGSVVDTLEAGVSVNSIDEEPSPGEACVLKTSALVRGVFFSHEVKKIDSRDIPRARTNPQRDTILISRMNTPDLVGEVAYIGQDYPWLFLPDRIWMTRFKKDCDLNVRWLSYVLSSHRYKSLLKGLSTGTSGSMKNISMDVLLTLPIRFPAGEEQTAIATVLSDMDTEIAALEARRDKTRVLKQGMMQQLLTGRVRLVAPKQAGSAA